MKRNVSDETLLRSVTELLKITNASNALDDEVGEWGWVVTEDNGILEATPERGRFAYEARAVIYRDQIAGQPKKLVSVPIDVFTPRMKISRGACEVELSRIREQAVTSIRCNRWGHNAVSA